MSPIAPGTIIHVVTPHHTQIAWHPAIVMADAGAAPAGAEAVMAMLLTSGQVPTEITAYVWPERDELKRGNSGHAEIQHASLT